MSVLYAIVIAFACFSAIPMPIVDWNERNMRYMMAAFPLVGALIGGMSWLWWLACNAVGFGTLIRAAGLTLIPLAVSGGIHMDGFTDVVDACSSHASAEHKRQILKDPHVGAFAIIGVGAYLVAYLGLSSELVATQLPAYACIFVISRCVSAYMAVSWRGSSPNGMFAAVHNSANKPVVQAIVGILCIASCIGMLACAPIPGVCALLAAVALLLWMKRLSAREFGSMSGDLLGFYVQSAELLMLACIVVVGRLV